MEKNPIQVFKKKFTKDFLVKKKSMGIFCKMNPVQNYKEFCCKIVCWRSPINLQGISFIKLLRGNILIFNVKQIVKLTFLSGLQQICNLYIKPMIGVRPPPGRTFQEQRLFLMKTLSLLLVKIYRYL